MATTTIDRDARDTLVNLMAYRYFLIGDLRIKRDRERGVPHEVLATWFEDDMAVMGDLGWAQRWCLDLLDLPESDRDRFEIRLPFDRLRPAIERALADARVASEAEDATPIPGSPDDSFDRAAQVCEALLTEMKRTEEQA
jgi:hypothetical protein